MSIDSSSSPPSTSSSSPNLPDSSNSLPVQKSRKATLNYNTLWRLNMSLKKAGCKTVDMSCRIRFIQEQGFEPPSGKVFIEDDINGLIAVTDKGIAGRWTLSEDKNDRKDGLWVWGLFEEPKYPYLYFNLNCFDSIILPSGEEEKIFNGEGIPNNQLNIRFNHVFKTEEGHLLSDGKFY